ncbi:hypothetical protein LINGRAHAP2_LOCUS35428 [Linum grandiflorum]
METHLWYVVPDEVKSASLLSQYMELLPQSERDHVLSFRGDQLQKSALLARTLVRTTIARYQVDGHLDPRSLRFKRNIHGKPEVEWQTKDDWCRPPLHFNISHTCSLVACGVAVNSSEAYVKALGKGFSAAPFKTFTIRVNTATRGRFYENNQISLYQESGIVVESVDNPRNDTNDWQFAVLELRGSHYVSICLEKEKMDGGRNAGPMKLCARRTIPLVEDELVSGTNAVLTIGGFVKHS